MHRVKVFLGPICEPVARYSSFSRERNERRSPLRYPQRMNVSVRCKKILINNSILSGMNPMSPFQSISKPHVALNIEF